MSYRVCDHYRIPQPIRMQSSGVQSQWMHLKKKKELPHPRLRQHSRRGSKMLVISRGSGNLLRNCLLAMSEAKLIRCPQHDCSNMNWTRTATNTPEWMEKVHKSTTLHQELHHQPNIKKRQNAIIGSNRLLSSHLRGECIKWSVLKTRIKITYSDRIYVAMCVYLCNKS